MTCSRFFLAAFIACLSVPAYAETPIMHFHSGTGFFVSREGYVLTNAHVVKECEKYALYGAGKTMHATLIDVDKEHDLALLKTNQQPTAIGQFEEGAQIGDALTVTGYPDDAWKNKKPVTRTARLQSLKGPEGEATLLQFSDVIAQGNSGGPLLNQRGNVAGVITARSTLTKMDADTEEVLSVRYAGVAVKPEVAMAFLKKMGVKPAVANPASVTHTRNFIVNVRCRVD